MLFNFISGLFSNDMAIDLGTSNTKVYVKDQGVILCEPSIVAIRKGINKVLAVGSEAKRMLGRTPADIVAIKPMKDGVISDFEVTEDMLKYFIRKGHSRRTFVRPRIIVCVPSGVTEVEKRAVKDTAVHAGAREVYLVEEPMAAAIGAELPIGEATGSMVIDIGGGTTEVAVISLGGIVCSKSLRVGGNGIDEAIIQYLKRKYNFLVGEPTAEDIKLKIGSAFPLEEELTLQVNGRDMVTGGLPKMLTITSQEIREAISGVVGLIIEAVRSTLEQTPPELAADIVDRGIIMAGGGALLRGMDKLLAHETNLPVSLTEDPISTTVLGTGTILEELDVLRELTLSERRGI